MTDNRLAIQGAQPPTFQQQVAMRTPAIAGFTEENQFRVRFPREGKIHLGIKVQYQKRDRKTKTPLFDDQGQPVMGETPAEADHFVLPDVLLNDVDFQATLVEIGNADPQKPTRLPVWLPSNNIADNITSSWDRYSKTRGLLCRSTDGETAKCRNETTGESVEKPCLNKKCPFAIAPPGKAADCALIHRLRVMLPDANGFGIWQIDTKSPNNWANLTCEMSGILDRTGGRLAGLDLYLERSFEERLITYTQGGETKQQLKMVGLLHLKTAVKLRDLRKAAAATVVDWTIDDVDEVDTEYDELLHVDAEEVDQPDDFMSEFRDEDQPPMEDAETTEPDGLRDELIDEINVTLQALFGSSDTNRRGIIGSALRVKPADAPEVAACTTDQLLLIRDQCRAVADQRARSQTSPQGH